MISTPAPASATKRFHKAVHIALGVRGDGRQEILGLWLEQNQGARFWPRVMNELRNRGVEDILLSVVDGLKGFPEAILAAFPGQTHHHLASRQGPEGCQPAS